MSKKKKEPEGWAALIGKKIVAFRGSKIPGSHATLDYILFDDKKTFIQLRAQDRADHHDCSDSAREINIYENPTQWKEMFDCVKVNAGYSWAEPEYLGHHPFD